MICLVLKLKYLRLSPWGCVEGGVRRGWLLNVADVLQELTREERGSAGWGCGSDGIVVIDINIFCVIVIVTIFIILTLMLLLYHIHIATTTQFFLKLLLLQTRTHPQIIVIPTTIDNSLSLL